MIISELILKQFRNYSHLSVEFSPTINYITGENGAGKSNILEAISLLSTLKSFRGASDSDMISWGSPGFFCAARTGINESHFFEMGCALSEDGIKKRLKIDSQEIRRASDFFGKLLVVIFSPLDIGITGSGPEVRRRFFDTVQSKTDTSYLRLLSEFKKVLTARNRLLRDSREGRSHSTALFDVWNDLFIRVSWQVILHRRDFIMEYQNIFQNIFESISGETSPIIEYKPSWQGDSEDALRKVLDNVRKNEFRAGTSLVGPQRDDYLIRSINEIPFTTFASQGQKRMAAISLRLAEASYLEKKKLQQCIILVDDVFSELDVRRRKGLVNHLVSDRQVIFTMVDADITGDFISGARQLRIDNGVVRQLIV